MRAFEPAGASAQVTAGIGGSDRIALSVLPSTAKKRVRVTNIGTVVAYVNFGSNTVTAAVATGHPILPGSFQDLVVPQGATHMAAVVGSTTAVVIATEGY